MTRPHCAALGLPETLTRKGIPIPTSCSSQSSRATATGVEQTTAIDSNTVIIRLLLDGIAVRRFQNRDRWIVNIDCARASVRVLRKVETDAESCRSWPAGFWVLGSGVGKWDSGASGPRPPGVTFKSPGRRPKAPPTFQFVQQFTVGRTRRSISRPTSRTLFRLSRRRAFVPSLSACSGC